jgi:hypothetical protein
MKRIAVLLGVLALMAPSVALAEGSSSCQTYSPELCSSVDASNSGTPGTSATTNTASTLPFTGLDVVLLVVGGGALLSAGFVVRRVSRRLN